MPRSEPLYKIDAEIPFGQGHASVQAWLWSYAGGEPEWSLHWLTEREISPVYLARIPEDEMMEIESKLVAEYEDYREGAAADALADYRESRE